MLLCRHCFSQQFLVKRIYEKNRIFSSIHRWKASQNPKWTIIGNECHLSDCWNVVFSQWTKSLMFTFIAMATVSEAGRWSNWWRSRRAVNQSETSFGTELTSLLKRKEPLLGSWTIQLQRDTRYGWIPASSWLKSPWRCSFPSNIIGCPLQRLKLCIFLKKTAQTNHKDSFWGRFGARLDRDDLQQWGEWIQLALTGYLTPP